MRLLTSSLSEGDGWRPSPLLPIPTRKQLSYGCYEDAEGAHPSLESEQEKRENKEEK